MYQKAPYLSGLQEPTFQRYESDIWSRSRLNRWMDMSVTWQAGAERHVYGYVRDVACIWICPWRGMDMSVTWLRQSFFSVCPSSSSSSSSSISVPSPDGLFWFPSQFWPPFLLSGLDLISMESTRNAFHDWLSASAFGILTDSLSLSLFSSHVFFLLLSFYLICSYISSSLSLFVFSLSIC